MPHITEPPTIEKECSPTATGATLRGGQTTARSQVLGPSLEEVELELAIDADRIRIDGFDAAVRRAILSVDGEFLFDLPASGLTQGFQRIAAVRLMHKSAGPRLMLVMLADDGETIRVSEPDEETAGLADFARAFVNVLERL